jgi:sentrin-specific protease 1
LDQIKQEKAKLLTSIRCRRLNPPPPSLPELPDEAVEVIQRALSSLPTTTIIERFFIPITARDLRTLQGASWLNDEIINFYFELIAERSAGSVHVMNTFFYPKLKDSGYPAVRRWTKKVDIFAKERILLPVHLGVHWCVAEVDVRGKKIVYYDSLHGSNEVCLQLLLDWLKAEHLDKKSHPLPTPELWQLSTPHQQTPPQQNGYDCGVFTCVTAEHRSRNAGLFYSQAHMSYFRQRLSYEIITGRLLV